VHRPTPAVRAGRPRPGAILCTPRAGVPLPSPLATERELADFLQSVERRAFRRTSWHVRNDDAALDIVQDAMLKLAEHYADRPATELPMLFQRILGNCTTDWFRREKTRNAHFLPMSDLVGEADGEPFDLLEALAVTDAAFGTESAADAAGRQQMLALIESAVAELPGRQREAFLLRYWEEFDVAETAVAMGCSEGSVKTHCSRALQALARALRGRGLAP
jgi:RNA polymerase sigma-70 factor, ECF subfamily